MKYDDLLETPYWWRQNLHRHLLVIDNTLADDAPRRLKGAWPSPPATPSVALMEARHGEEPEPSALEVAERDGELQDAVERILVTMEHKEQVVTYFHLMHGWSMGELSRYTGWSKGQIHYLKERAVAVLQPMLLEDPTVLERLTDDNE